jgi:hypothetical protein
MDIAIGQSAPTLGKIEMISAVVYKAIDPHRGTPTREPGRLAGLKTEDIRKHVCCEGESLVRQHFEIRKTLAI